MKNELKRLCAIVLLITGVDLVVESGGRGGLSFLGSAFLVFFVRAVWSS